MATATRVQQVPPDQAEVALSQDQLTFQQRLAVYMAAQAVIQTGLLVLVTRFFKAMTNPYNPVQVATYSRQVAQAVRRAQVAQLNLAMSHQRILLADQGVTVPRSTFQLPARPRGVDPIEVAQRAAREYRLIDSNKELKERLLERAAQRAEKQALEAVNKNAIAVPGVDGGVQQMAFNQGLTRALVTAAADLGLARREGYRQQLQKAPAKVLVGYRRVIHPERSAGGTCGLCVAAADRIYHVADLQAIHDRCECTVSPVIEGKEDVGKVLNQADLGALYKLAGSTSGDDLKDVRFRIDQHGELGSYLRPRFAGADDPATAILKIDATLKGLGIWAGKRGGDVNLGEARDIQLGHRKRQQDRAASQN